MYCPGADRVVLEFRSDPLLDAMPPVRLHVEVPRGGDEPTLDDVAAIGRSALAALAALLRQWADEAEVRAGGDGGAARGLNGMEHAWGHSEFERSFTAAFNDACDSHRILKFGIESTDTLEDHDHIMSAANDPTAGFIRFLPDAVLVGLGAGCPEEPRIRYHPKKALPIESR